MATATVYIWLPDGIHYAVGAGHGALELTRDNGKTCYITWTPANSGGKWAHERWFTSQGMEANKRLGFKEIRDRDTNRVVPNPDVLGGGNSINFDSDKRAHAFLVPEAHELGIVAPPQYQINVPVFTHPAPGPDDNMFGLNAELIARFWKNLLALPAGDSKRRYGVFSPTQNCNGVVVEALLAGGLGMYADPPSNYVYQDARTLLRWVEEACGTIDKLNRQYRKIAKSQAGGRQGALPINERRIPTLTEWKASSNEGIAWYARRTDQVASLDELIPIYHQAKSVNNHWLVTRTLLKMTVSIYDHLVNKPNSDRRQAMLNLAKRVFVVLADQRGENNDELVHLNPNPNQGAHAQVLI